ncbi:uncharacterized protein LOC135692446 [Rhopilema esculentum]|uniref:uncharacterized protein LOC135692446 n=1 Tax=Rhopilema esculentum TaxID=499914 RepID=UPI0031DB4288
MGILVKVGSIPKSVKIDRLSYHLANIQGGSALVHVEDFGLYYNAIYRFFDGKAGEEVIKLFDQKFLFGAKLSFNKVSNDQQQQYGSWNSNFGQKGYRYWNSIPSQPQQGDVYPGAGQILQNAIFQSIQGAALNMLQRQRMIANQLASSNLPLHWTQAQDWSRTRLAPRQQQQNFVQGSRAVVPRPLMGPQEEAGIEQRGLVKASLNNSEAAGNNLTDKRKVEMLLKFKQKKQEHERKAKTGQNGSTSRGLLKDQQISETMSETERQGRVSNTTENVNGHGNRANSTQNEYIQSKTHATTFCTEMISDDEVFEKEEPFSNQSGIAVHGNQKARKNSSVGIPGNGSKGSSVKSESDGVSLPHGEVTNIRQPTMGAPSQRSSSVVAEDKKSLLKNRKLQAGTCSLNGKIKAPKNRKVFKEWQKNTNYNGMKRFRDCNMNNQRNSSKDEMTFHCGKNIDEANSVNAATNPQKENDSFLKDFDKSNIRIYGGKKTASTRKNGTGRIAKKLLKRAKVKPGNKQTNKAKMNFNCHKDSFLQKKQQIFRQDSILICKIMKLVARKLPDQEERLVHAMYEILTELSDEVLMSCERFKDRGEKNRLAV